MIFGVDAKTYMYIREWNIGQYANIFGSDDVVMNHLDKHLEMYQRQDILHIKNKLYFPKMSLVYRNSKL